MAWEWYMKQGVLLWKGALLGFSAFCGWKTKCIHAWHVLSWITSHGESTAGGLNSESNLNFLFSSSSFPLLASLGTICTDKFCLCFCRLKLKLSQLGEHCSSANTTRWQHDFKVTLDTQIFKRLQAGTASPPPLPQHHNLFVTYSPRLKILISNNKK